MKRVILLTMCALFFGATVFAQSDTQDEGVVINGVKWATRNVGEKGKFVEYPEDAGKYYLFSEAKNVCPSGWRLPTLAEIEMLVTLSHEWGKMEGVTGMTFSRRGSSIFLPAAGVRKEDSLFRTGIIGAYLSSTPHTSPFDSWGKILYFNSEEVETDQLSDTSGGCVRCVAE